MRWIPICLLAACGSSEPSGPITAHTISPTVGSVGGGTRVTIEGTGLDGAKDITIGGIDCGDLAHESGSRVRCTTGARLWVEGPADVIVTGAHDQRAELPGAYRYECEWTTSSGRRTCGAAPPRLMVEEQKVTKTMAQFGETMQTNGHGAPLTIARSLSATDARNQQLKVFLSVQNFAQASELTLLAGDAGLTNAFQFRLRGGQGQQWITDGDMVGISVSWSPDNYTTVGNPNRAFITDVAVRVADSAQGVPVSVKVESVGLVPEPRDRFPDGVLTFTFDDNWDDMVQVGAPALAKYNFPATAFVIVDRVGMGERATLGDLKSLQENGWDIAAHAFTSVHHDQRWPLLPANVAEDDLVDTRAWLMSNGFNGYDHCAYPGGDFTSASTSVLPMVAKYFASCRTIYQRQREASPPSDPRKLRVLYVTNAVSLLAAQQAVTYARANREWIIVVFHKLVDGAASATTEWPASDFLALVDHVKQSGIDVQTVTQVLDEK